MAQENSFSRAQKHPLWLTVEGSKASEGFVNGWNAALTISLSINTPPAQAAGWYPLPYQQGWENCRALLETLQKGKRSETCDVVEVQRVVEETERAFARLSG